MIYSKFPMLPTPRRYHDEHDLARMLSLLQAGRAAGIPSYYVHTGDLQWWLYYPALGSSFWEHIYLWEDPAEDNHLMGWALLDPTGETFDVFFRPELNGSALAAEMLTWAEEAVISLARASAHRKTGMFWVTPGDGFRTRWLEDRGYRVSYQSAALARSLAEPIPECSIPEGFTVRSCRGLAEVEARARAQYGAFSNTAPFEQYLRRFTQFMQSPAYAPEADVVAVSGATVFGAATSGAEDAPDGCIAAFCITWTDTANRVGLFEPVGTHPAFQRKGLGKAVMLEALRRLRALGMQQAIVCTVIKTRRRSTSTPPLGFSSTTSSAFTQRIWSEMAEKRTLTAPQGLYFEDFEPGQSITSGGRTVTEADVVGFAALTGDWTPIHTDAVYAASHPFGQRVAHGLLGMSIAVALAMRMGFLDETVLAFREISGWKFSQPIHLGDTIHMRATVTETQPVHRLKGGLVTFEVEILNQADTIVQHGRWVMLVKSRGENT